MSDIVIGDIAPYTQAVATGGQTVFGTNWTADVFSDVVVFLTPIGMAPNDQTQLLAYPAQYSVVFVGALQQVQVTLVAGANAGDIVTITRMTPAARMNLYTNANFSPTMLNNDFGILTLVDQQAQLVNQLIAPRYNYSANIAPNMLFPNANIILPILAANQIWVKAADNNSIIAVNIPGGGGGGGGVNAGLQNQIAWYAATGSTVSGLPSIANSVLMTDGAGVPFLGQTLPNAVQLNITKLGTQTQNLNMGGFGINNLLNPINPQDAATKDYVDMIAAGISVQPSTAAATTANLNATYANGAAGVGATLTNAGAMAAFSTDGVNPAINSRILVKNQTAPAQNGVYTLTTVGSGAANWVLTRATNYDTPGEINPGNLFFVDTGVTQAGEAWVETQTVTTIGTDPINFSLFSTGIFALKGANADITSMSALTGYLQAPLGVKDAYGNIVNTFETNVVNAVNYVSLLNNSTGNAPVVSAKGADANIQLLLKGKGTSGVGIQGVSTNTAAAAGNVGEYNSSVIAYAAGINPASSTITNLTSIIVPAGDFDVWANFYFHSTGFGIGAVYGWISETALTQPDLSLMSVIQVGGNILSQASAHPPMQRFLNAAPTRVYADFICYFTSGVTQVAGGIYYRRR